MREYIITFEDDDWFFDYLHENYTHFFGCPIEEIVRCRDCKYATADQSDHDFRELLWCNFHRMDVKPDGFCAWGERR